MRRIFTLWHGIALSLSLHAALILPFLIGWPQRQQPKRDETLVVQLQGEIANRQTTEQTVEQHRPQPEPTPPQKQELSKPEEKPSPRPELALPRPKPKPRTEPPPPQAAPPTPTPNATDETAGNASQQERQQAISRDQEAERLRVYLAAMKNRLKSRLAYPEKMKALGIKGTTTIGFVIAADGSLRRETLRVLKSSGFPELDAGALAAASASAPFDPPPREINIAIGVDFQLGN